MEIFLSTLFIVICVLLVLVVLLQKGRGGGLGAMFGGAGSSAFGTRTGDVFTWVTIVLAALFFLLAIAAVLVHRPEPGIVSAPRLQPPPGPITSRTFVTMQTPTGGATIYYTLDGSDPTVESTPYEQAIEVQPGTPVQARAYRPGWQPSPIVGGLYGTPTTSTAPADQPDQTPQLGQPVDQEMTAPLTPAGEPAAEPDVLPGQ